MRCAEFESFLYPYLDGEFAEPELAEMEVHLARCPACRHRVEMERWLIDQLKVHAVRTPHAPEELQRRIGRELASVQATAATRQSWLPGYVWKPVPAVFGLGVLLFFLWPMMGSSIDPVVEELVAQHLRPTGVDVAGPELSRLQRYYSKKLPFDFKLLRFDNRNSIVLGGRVDRVHDRPSARIFYDYNGEKLSLVVFQGDAGLAEPLPDARWVVRDVNGYHVALYREHGLTYGLTSRMDARRLQHLVQQASFSP